MKKKRWIAGFLSVIMLLGVHYDVIAMEYQQQEPVDIIEEEKVIEYGSAEALTVTNWPDILPDAWMQEENHIARIKEEEDDLNSIVMLNDDDTATLYYFQENVKYVKDGVVYDKSNELYSAYNDAAHAENYAYVNSDNDIKTYFPKKLSEDCGVVLASDYGEIEVAPDVSASDDIHKEDGDGTDDYVYYEGIYGDGTRLEYSATYSGFKETIILADASTDTFEFILTSDELLPVCENNYIYLQDTDGNRVISMDPVYVIDSYKGEPVIYEDNYCHNTWNNIVDLEQLYGNTYKITVSVDKDFLSDARTVYPVYVDPSFNVTASGSGTSKTIQDVPIYNGSGAVNIASGSNTYNLLGYVGTSGGAFYGVGRLLMKFPGLLSNSVYKKMISSFITNATLYMYEGSGQSATATIYAYQYTGSTWTETGATYNTTSWNSYTSPYTSKNIGSSSQTWLSMDITNIVKGWKASSTNAAKGILLKNANESNSAYRKDFQSTESGIKPFLSVTYKYSGCKAYRVCTATNINCKGYACFTDDNVDFMSDENYLTCIKQSTSRETCFTLAVKDLDVWLRENFAGKYVKVSSPDAVVTSGQWMIAFRIGKNDAGTFDYHFWYRTDTGVWASKNGTNPSMLLPETDLPSNNTSIGWSKDGGATYFYNSDIAYYILYE